MGGAFVGLLALYGVYIYYKIIVQEIEIYQQKQDKKCDRFD